MSLTKAVTQKVHELGRATTDEVAAHFPNYTREQVAHALHNAAYRLCLTVERGRGLGEPRGSAPSTYVSCKAATQQPKESP